MTRGMAVFAGFLFLAIGLGSTAANASGTWCASPDAVLVYSTVRSDGGAAMGTTTDLTVNGSTVISVQPRGGHALHLGDFTMVGAIKKISTKKDGFYQTATYVQKMKVTQSTDSAVIFEGLVMCQDTVYNGPPRP